METSDLEEVEPITAQRQTVGERKGILDGQSHVGNAKLRLHAAIAEFHSTMDDAFRMDMHFNLRRTDTEQPLCLNHLKALVHHRCTVDGDFRPHFPIGMLQGLCRRDELHLIGRKMAERSATGSKDDARNAVETFSTETLENGGMFTVNRKYGRMILLRKCSDELARHH